MANPAGKHAEFTYSIEGGAPQTFSAASLDADETVIVLTCDGDLPIHGDQVTVSYTAGTVVADDGGVLATFDDYAVTNTVPL